jgi:ribosomal protein S18 acetylase RimI-like enzyme
MAYIIRHMRPEEVVLLGPIEIKAGKLFADAGVDEVANNPPADPAFIASFRRVGAVHVVADDLDAPVGFALTGLLDGAGHLYQLSVDPAHGKRGLGRRLVDAACGFAYSAGARALTLSTFRDLAWNAPFYRRVGFRELRPNEWTPAMHVLHAREIDMKLPIERRCFMRREL